MKRSDQQKAWMWYHIRHQILTRSLTTTITGSVYVTPHVNMLFLYSFKEHPVIRQRYSEYEEFVIDGIMTPGAAADELLSFFINHKNLGI